MTRIYLVYSDDENGNDMSLVVEAHSPADAVRLWRNDWDLTTDKKPAAVFEMPDRTGRPAVHQWPSLDRGKRSEW
jgi:hypothetical protein